MEGIDEGSSSREADDWMVDVFVVVLRHVEAKGNDPHEEIDDGKDEEMFQLFDNSQTFEPQLIDT